MALTIKWSTRRDLDEKSVNKLEDDLIGVYLLGYKDKEGKGHIMYVGKSEEDSLKSRLLAHITNESNEKLSEKYSLYDCYFRFAEIPKKSIKDVEYTLYILYNKPICNKNEPEGNKIEIVEEWP